MVGREALRDTWCPPEPALGPLGLCRAVAQDLWVCWHQRQGRMENRGSSRAGPMASREERCPPPTALGAGP